MHRYQDAGEDEDERDEAERCQGRDIAVRDEEKHQTRDEAPPLAEGDGVCPDAIQQVRLPVARLMREMAGREDQPEKGADCDRPGVHRAKGGIPDDIESVTVEVDAEGMPLGALLKAAGLVASSSEGNRAIDQGGCKIDGETVKDKQLRLPAGEYVIQVGKRRFAKVTVVHH